ncbi:MAG: hypothetical protein ACRELB_02980 [Polyangiaceae bacterium]
MSPRIRPALLRSAAPALLAALAVLCPSRIAVAQQPERGAMTRVELDQPETSLRQVVSYFTGSGWWYGQRVVCSAPCDMRVPTGATYEIVGDGIATSSPFELPRRSDVILQVRPGDATGRNIGGVLAVAGGLALAIGSVALIGAASSDHSGTVTGGLVGVGAGALLLGVGLPLMIANATTVRFE